MSTLSPSPDSWLFDPRGSRRPRSTPAVARERIEPLAAASVRSPDLDALRVLAAAGVVWIHATSVLDDAVGRFAVPMFVVAAVLLTAQSLRRRPEQSALAFVGRRWLRLLPAFLFWCVVYEAMRQAKWVMNGGLDAVRLEPLRFIGGTHEHLWFVPFLLVATLLAVPAMKFAIAGGPARRAGVAIVAFAAGLAWSLCSVPAAIDAVSPEGPWNFVRPMWWATPSLFVAIALASATIGSDGLGGLRMPRYAGYVGLAMLLVGTCANWDMQERPLLLAATLSGVGAVWMAAGAVLPRAVAGTIAPIGAQLGMGIYLCHVIFLRGCVTVAERTHLSASALTDVLAFAIAFTGAIVLAWLLNRSRWTRWTVGV